MIYCFQFLKKLWGSFRSEISLVHSGIKEINQYLESLNSKEKLEGDLLGQVREHLCKGHLLGRKLLPRFNNRERDVWRHDGVVVKFNIGSAAAFGHGAESSDIAKKFGKGHFGLDYF